MMSIFLEKWENDGSGCGKTALVNFALKLYGLKTKSLKNNQEMLEDLRSSFATVLS